MPNDVLIKFTALWICYTLLSADYIQGGHINGQKYAYAPYYKIKQKLQWCIKRTPSCPNDTVGMPQKFTDPSFRDTSLINVNCLVFLQTCCMQQFVPLFILLPLPDSSHLQDSQTQIPVPISEVMCPKPKSIADTEKANNSGQLIENLYPAGKLCVVWWAG